MTDKQDREDRVRERAYQRWEAEGRPVGRHDDHWHDAVREIEGETAAPEPTAETPAAKPQSKPRAAKPTPMPEAEPAKRKRAIKPKSD